jgi:hypothetical protein
MYKTTIFPFVLNLSKSYRSLLCEMFCYLVCQTVKKHDVSETGCCLHVEPTQLSAIDRVILCRVLNKRQDYNFQICLQSQVKYFLLFYYNLSPQHVSTPMGHLQVEHNINHLFHLKGPKHVVVKDCNKIIKKTFQLRLHANLKIVVI